MSAPKFASYDAVIVGSGIAGALIALRLGLAGKRVLILEAGAALPPNVNDYMERFYNASAKVPEIPYATKMFAGNGRLVDPATLNVPRPTVLALDVRNWKDASQNYLIQKGPLPFASTYDCVGGGTANHWLGSSFRFLPNDFRMKSMYQKSADWPEGMVNWPIEYKDLEPWYCDAERAIGVSADVQEQSYLGIGFQQGYSYPMPTIPPSLVDKTVSSAIADLQIDGIPLQVHSTPAARNSQPYQDRRVCAGNTNCIPICPIQAKYDPSVTLNEAFRTGNVDVLYQTVASDVVVDGSGRVTQVKYVQYEKESEPQSGGGSISAKVFILAAHAIETPKLLLMSKNGGRTPKGVANTNDVVGKYLMDHPYYVPWALTPKPIFPYRGPLSTSGIEILRDGPFRSERGAYRVDIANEGWNFIVGGIGGDPNVTTVDFINGLNRSGLNRGGPNGSPETLFGTNLVDRLNDVLSRQLRLGFLIEQSPDASNRVELSDQLDNLKLPRPLIRYDLSPYTKRGIAAAKQAADKIFAKLGAEQFTKVPDENDPSSFPWEIDGKTTRLKYYGSGHIVGTYRMGDQKNDSVVDSDLRSWEHKNLFLVGSGVFPTVATGNPTLTIAALSLRAADKILKVDLR